MNIREWIANNIGYRLGGCFYNYFTPHKVLFEFIKSKTPSDFTSREISDLGCGDGQNTLKIIKIFKPKKVVGYDQNESLLKRAKKRDLKVKKVNLNERIPKGEMAVFTFALHHLHDKEEALQKVVNNFKYVFLCEPINDLYHFLFDGGRTLAKKDWIVLFDKVFGKYQLYQHKSSLIVFYKN